MPKKTGVVRRIATKTYVPPLSAGSTVGKMRMYRKSKHPDEVGDLAAVSCGHMNTPPTRSVARRISCNL